MARICSTTRWTRTLWRDSFSIVRADESRRRRDRQGRRRRSAAGRRRPRAPVRPPLARRGRPSLALPPGPHPGPQDGQGDDLVAGALRVHARELDADPPRPLRLRQVRQARRRLQRRLLVSQIRKILRTSGQHNIALFGAGHLGKAIASSDIFADHGFRVVAIFDQDPAKLGEKVGPALVRHPDDLKAVVDEEDIVVGVLAVPTAAAQELADKLVDAGVKIIFNYSEALLAGPARGDGPYFEPGRRPSRTRCTSTSPRASWI